MSKEQLTIREANIEDRANIETLWKDVIDHAFKKEGMDAYHNPLDELDFKMNQFDQAFKKKTSTFYVAYKADELVGTIAYGTPPNRGILRRTNNALIDRVEIGSLYIDPIYQKKGYGKILLVHILEALKEQKVDTVCFDSIIESSKQIWRKIFGEPTYLIPSEKHDFTHMIWVVDVQQSINNLKK